MVEKEYLTYEEKNRLRMVVNLLSSRLMKKNN